MDFPECEMRVMMLLCVISPFLFAALFSLAVSDHLAIHMAESFSRLSRFSNSTEWLLLLDESILTERYIGDVANRSAVNKAAYEFVQDERANIARVFLMTVFCFATCICGLSYLHIKGTAGAMSRALMSSIEGDDKTWVVWSLRVLISFAIVFVVLDVFHNSFSASGGEPLDALGFYVNCILVVIGVPVALFLGRLVK